MEDLYLSYHLISPTARVAYRPYSIITCYCSQNTALLEKLHQLVNDLLRVRCVSNILDVWSVSSHPESIVRSHNCLMHASHRVCGTRPRRRPSRFTRNYNRCVRYTVSPQMLLWALVKRVSPANIRRLKKVGGEGGRNNAVCGGSIII